MSRYLLDTNAVIATLNSANCSVARRVRRHAPATICISAIVVHELFYGAFKSRRREHNVSLVDALQFEVLAFDTQDAREAGAIRAALAALGKPIGPYDILIAGQARARKLTLITHNVDEFSRVPDLSVEDWQTAG